MWYEHKLSTKRRDIPITQLFDRAFEMLSEYKPYVHGPGIIATSVPIGGLDTDMVDARLGVTVRPIGFYG